VVWCAQRKWITSPAHCRPSHKIQLSLPPPCTRPHRAAQLVGICVLHATNTQHVCTDAADPRNPVNVQQANHNYFQYIPAAVGPTQSVGVVLAKCDTYIQLMYSYGAMGQTYRPSDNHQLQAFLNTGLPREQRARTYRLVIQALLAPTTT
jgi:hypothetical protein